MKIVLEISCQLCFNESIKNRRNNSKSKTSLKLKNFKELYNAMVCPYLTYCDINWESTYPTRPKSIYIAQKKIVRLRTFSSFRETSQPLFKLLKIMNIYEINLYLIANFM